MNARHAIFQDREFWSHLEFTLTGWLADHEEKDLRRFWIDGFIPEGIKDTKYGADVEGKAWVGTSAREQSAYRFVASIPQSLLARTNREYRLSEVHLNPENRQIEFTIEKKANNAEKVGAATARSPLVRATSAAPTHHL